MPQQEHPLLRSTAPRAECNPVAWELAGRFLSGAPGLAGKTSSPFHCSLFHRIAGNHAELSVGSLFKILL